MRFIMGVEDLRSASLPAARGVVLFLESAGIRQRRAPPRRCPLVVPCRVSS